MYNRFLPTLIELAQTSNMSSRHAAAIINNKQILASAVNHTVPAAHLVAVANTVVNRGTCCRNIDCLTNTSGSQFSQMYQRFSYLQEERQCVHCVISSIRCKKYPQIEKANKATGIGTSSACRRKCIS